METNGSYYLIDNKVRYYPASQLVKNAQSTVQLTDFQHKLLAYFLENPKVVRSYIQISEQVWPNKITTVDAFNKHLGAIRIALDSEGKAQKNHYIKTWSREGYGLGCSCIYVKNKREPSNLKKWLTHIVGTSAGITLITVFFLFAFRSPIYEANGFIKPTSLQGILSEPALSHDGKYIAFTAYNDEFKGRIYAKKLSERDHVVLTQGHDDKLPIWNKKADKLLYHRLENKQCQIRLITFASPLMIENDKLLLPCSPTSFSVSMAFKNDHSFYFTDSKTHSGPYSIYQFDLNSGTRTLLLSPQNAADEESTGYTRIRYQADQDKLYIIQSLDWIYSQVLVFHDGQLEKLADIDASLNSVGLFKDSFIYKDSSNRLIFNTQQQPLTTDWNGLIMHPSVSSGSNKIAFYSGHMYHWNMYAYHTKTETTSQLTFDNAENRFPLKTAEHFYYSSDFTGITQIYRVPSEGKEPPFQLTNFKKNRRATQISLSPDAKMLAISYVSSTDLYHLRGDSLTLLRRFESQIYPAFSRDSLKIMLTRLEQKDSRRSVEYNLKTLQPTGITIPQSRYAIYHPRGLIYASTIVPGIFLFNNGDTTTINDTLVTYTPADISLSETFLYAVHKKSRVIKKISISGNKVSNLPLVNVGQLYLYQDVIYYSVEQTGESSIYVGDIKER